MRIIFLGTPEFGAITLQKLLESNHEVIAVITQKDKPQGRGNKITPSPVKVFAEKANIKCLEYDKISRDGIDDLKALHPDIMITAAYGQILSQDIIDIPKFGIINVHASLLPKYRGASPIQSAIIGGESKTGVTIMQTEAGLDTGDILGIVETEIGEYETAGELSKRLAHLGANLLIEVLEKIKNKTIKPVPQLHVNATVTRKIQKEDCVINFNKSAKQIKCLVCGANPDPIASAVFEQGTVLKIYSVRLVDFDADGEPGEVIEPTSAKKGVFVKCNPGVIELGLVQLPGKGVMEAKNLVNGRKIGVGDKFKFNVSQVVSAE